MSSFLMNSGTYGSTDPKFPSTEEYSQASYIPHSDYYNQHMQAAAAQHYGYGAGSHAAYKPRDVDIQILKDPPPSLG